MYTTCTPCYGQEVPSQFHKRLGYDVMQALRKDNVKVVLINPGPIATAMTEVNMAENLVYLVGVHAMSANVSAHCKH